MLKVEADIIFSTKLVANELCRSLTVTWKLTFRWLPS